MSDKELERWNGTITLNSTIAIFTTAAKSTLLIAVAGCVSQWKWFHFKEEARPLRDLELYDEASRGSLGSVEFLFRLRWGVPALGAIITILALGIDTFSQQIIALDTRPVPIQNNTVATLAYAHTYRTDANTSAFGDEWDVIETTRDNAMQAAIYSGLYNLGKASIANCSSTCTWPGEYDSLGIRNTCTNVTIATMESRECNTTVSSGGKRCNITTPGGVRIDTFFQPTNVQTLVAIGASRVAGTRSPVSTSLISSELLRLAIFRAPSSYNNRRDIIGEEVTECSLSLVGVSASNVSAAGSNLDMKPELLDLGTGRYEGNRSFVFSREGFPDLRVNTLDIGSFLDFFESSLFSGSMFDGYRDYAPADLRTSEGVAGGFFNGNPTDILDRMALSMTDHIRLGVNREISVGAAYFPVVFVRVVWPWITLNLLAETATAVLLLLTVLKSWRFREVPLWKESGIAVLLHNVVLPDGVLRSDYKRAEDLDDIAHNVRAKLE
ncbi:hypothetical protein GE09DRAFT_1064040 [Coniochaeta sp. 2T2.1]|nr:hypothetical protein GE09DRAFT_1064040 [Coniochaeta sp. 2T2.1]